MHFLYVLWVEAFQILLVCEEKLREEVVCSRNKDCRLSKVKGRKKLKKKLNYYPKIIFSQTLKGKPTLIYDYFGRKTPYVLYYEVVM